MSECSGGCDAVLQVRSSQIINRQRGGPRYRLSRKTVIEAISKAYRTKAAVVSADPRGCTPQLQMTPDFTLKTAFPGPSGEESIGINARSRAEESLGISAPAHSGHRGSRRWRNLLNCIDRDGKNSGFDLDLINSVKLDTQLPVIASSGAGNPAHFEEVVY